MGPRTGAGCALKAISCPEPCPEPRPWADGGGGAVAELVCCLAPPPAAPACPIEARCSVTGSLGREGEAASLPTFMAPGRRRKASGVGGGSIKDGWMGDTDLNFVPAGRSGAGLTASASKVGNFLREIGTSSGGGLMTAVCWKFRSRRERGNSSGGGAMISDGVRSFGCGFRLAESGWIGSERSAHATMLGSLTALARIFRSGVTTVCCELSGSGGTEMISCFAKAGAPLTACVEGFGREVMEGRYSLTE